MSERAKRVSRSKRTVRANERVAQLSFLVILAQGVMVTHSLILPQGQAFQWICGMEPQLQILKTKDPNYLKDMERAIQVGQQVMTSEGWCGVVSSMVWREVVWQEALRGVA